MYDQYTLYPEYDYICQALFYEIIHTNLSFNPMTVAQYVHN